MGVLLWLRMVLNLGCFDHDRLSITRIPQNPTSTLLPSRSLANKTLQYAAATKTSSLDPTAKAIASLASVFAKDPKLGTILQAPTLSASDKSQIITELQKHAGSGGDVIKQFLQTLAENNRLGVLERVCEKFAVLMSAHKGEVEMIVTSAAVSFLSGVGEFVLIFVSLWIRRF
jgi:hypothetical protein